MSKSWERLPLISVAYQAWQFMTRVLKDLSLTIWLWISLFFVLNSIPLVVITMVSAIGGIGLIVSAVRWWFYRFRFGEDAIEIHEGVIGRVNKKIPYSNVINVEINQPWIYRPTQYVELIFDSAGSKKKDGIIPCINRERAEEIKSSLVLQSKMDESEVEAVDNGTLVSRQVKDLFIFGMAHNRVFLFIGLMIGAYYKVKEVVKDIDGRLMSLYDKLVSDIPVVIIGIVILILLIMLSALMSGALQVVKSYGYRLWRDKGKLVQTEGLFTKKENSITLEKLQRVVIRRTILDRLVRRCSLKLVQLNGEMVVPALRMTEAFDLCKSIGKSVPGKQYIRGALYSFIRNSIIALPALLWLAYEAWRVDEVGFSVFFAASGLLYVIFSCLRWFRFGYQLDERSLMVKTGRIDERTYIVELLKCQAVTISQSWIERQFGMATVKIHFVMKTLPIRGIPIGEALQIRDASLKQIEKTMRWF